MCSKVCVILISNMLCQLMCWFPYGKPIYVPTIGLGVEVGADVRIELKIYLNHEKKMWKRGKLGHEKSSLYLQRFANYLKASFV